MARPTKRERRAAEKRQLAAIQATLGGIVLLLLPVFMRHSIFAAMFRPLAPLGWLLLIGGCAALWYLHRRSASLPASPSQAPFAPSPRAPRRPSRPTPLVERIDPVQGSVFEPERGSWVEPERKKPSERAKPMSWGPGVFAEIEWRRFEAVVETLFAQAGFVTKALSHGPDGGVDVWLYSKSQVDGKPVSIVQCKHWQGKQVGVDKVRELRGVMAAEGITRGQFATTSTFTPDAVAFAGANGIKLHDGAGLLWLIASRTQEQQQDLLDVALEGDYWRPTCASCGIKLVRREPMAGGKPFWGCTNFPRCRTKMQLRAV